MGIGDLVQDKNYNKVGLRLIGLIIDGPYHRRINTGSGNVKIWVVLWNNGKKKRIRLKEVKVISHA